MTARRIFLALLLGIFLDKAYGDGCISDKKCSCYHTQEYEFHCPPDNFQVLIHAVSDRYMKLDCLNLTEYNIDMFPDFVAGNVDFLKLRSCPLPNNFLPSLKKFNITDLNKLYLEQCSMPKGKISRRLFDGLPLQILSLSLMEDQLEVDALYGLTNLSQLYLDGNSIAELDYFFGHNEKLKVLHLSRNAIRYVPDGVFGNLTELQQLHLWSNDLRSVTRGCFSGLKNLKSLELSKNNISYVANDSFSELPKLINVSLRSNKLKSVSPDLFKNNLMLEGIRIGDNLGLVLPDFLFANLPKLKSVNMDSSGLETVPRNIFLNSNNLTDIMMSNNRIGQLPDGMFDSLANIKKLDLSRNKIGFLPAKIFSSLRNLEELNLGQNYLSEIGGSFGGLNNLKYLTLRNNAIRNTSLNAFSSQEKLLRLDMSYNFYDFPVLVEEANPFTNCQDLEELVLSHNNITRFPGNVLYNVRMRLLDMSFNDIEEVDVSSFIKLATNQVIVDLRNNSITGLNFADIKVIAKVDQKRYDAGHNNENATVVFLQNNSFICDCRNFDLVQYLNGNIDPLSVRTLVDLRIGSSRCSEPEDFRHILVGDVPADKMICPYPNRHCPASCACFYRPYDNMTVVDCSRRNLTAFPDVTSLRANVELNLIGNLLEDGPSEKLVYGNVRNMFLSDNKIKSFGWVPPRIRVLKLDGNRLSSINSNVLNVLKGSTNFEELTLGNNPWSCGCSALDLWNFLNDKYDKVKREEVICHEDKMALVNKTELCRSNVQIILRIVVPVLLFLFLTATLIALYFRFRTEILVWLFFKFPGIFPEDELDKDKTYDIFISYSHKDEDFVMQNLLPVLEKGPRPFEVCLHVRDFMPGEFISTQIVDSVLNSRRTLVILSDNFLESVWGKLEFRTAHTQALEDGRARVVIIKYGELTEEKLDDELRSYLKTNTYVEWGNPWFWKQLNYALPHSRRQNFYRDNQRHASVMLKIDDKFELTSKQVAQPESTPPVLALDPALLKDHPLNFGCAKSTETPPAEAPLITR